MGCALQYGARCRSKQAGSEAVCIASPTVKLMIPTVLCLTPPVYILLAGPAVIEIRNFITKENRNGGVLTQTMQSRSNPNAIGREEPNTAE
mgnify:CR=1 FL=1